MADYEFRYSPLTGRLTGKQMIEQTEQAINQLSSLVDSAAGQVEIISTLANEANENAATALETAEEALATTGRTYITVSTQTDANNYYDSQLIYIADSTSTNIPVADTGMLEVKTNDNKTACEQVFISDSSGDAYYRNGAITAETVGDVTTYTVTWGGWSSQPASQAYVQGELANYLPLSGGTVTGGLTVEGPITGNLDGNAGTATNATNDANGNPIAGTYLPLSGGTVTGGLTVEGTITGNLAGNANTATNATNDANGNPIAGTYLSLTGGTMTGTITTTGYPAIKSPTNADQITIAGGSSTEASDGAKFILSGGTRSSNAGEFTVQAGNGNGYKQLVGKPSGEFTWGGSNVAVMGTLQNGHGILTGYKDSISVNANTYAQGTISFGQTFSSVPMVVVCCGMGHAHIHAACSNITTTGFAYVVSSEGPAFTNERINWIAIG